MVPESFIVVLYYGYPLALYITLSLSLLLSRIRQRGVFEITTGHRLAVIYALQGFLCLSTAASLGLATSNFVTLLWHDEPSGLNEAQVICYAAALLYFFVGLLPDPEDAFHPSPSHTYAWITAAIFKVAIQTLTWEYAQKRTDVALWALGITRLFALLDMFAIYHFLPGSIKPKVEETESLLNSSGPSDISYGSTSRTNPPQRTVGKGGWLDYFIGFRLLFPHLWPSKDWKQQITLLICLVLMIGQRILNVLVPYYLEVLIGNLGRGTVPLKAIAIYVLCRGLQGQQGVLGSLRAIL